jgi:hypothetical protein
MRNKPISVIYDSNLVNLETLRIFQVLWKNHDFLVFMHIGHWKPLFVISNYTAIQRWQEKA